MFSENTKIAHIDVSGKDKKEALQMLISEQEDWLQSTNIELFYKERQEQFDFSIFQFQLEETVNKAVSGKENRCFVQINEESLDKMQLIIGKDGQLDQQKLEKTLLSFARMFDQGPHTIRLENFLTDPLSDEDIISETTIRNEAQLQHLNRWVEEFPTIQIEPHGRLSLLQVLSDNEKQTYPTEALSTIASAMYEVLLQTNFIISERHISQQLPGYADVGFESRVDMKNKLDLVVLNPNDHTYTLESHIVDQALHMTLKGPSFLYTYKIVFEDRETVKKKTIVQYDSLLSRGQIRTGFAGADGVLIKVYRKTIDENGVDIDRELIAEDFYPPLHRVEVRSLIEKDVEVPESDLEEEASQNEVEREDDQAGYVDEVEIDVKDEPDVKDEHDEKDVKEEAK